MPSEQLSMLQKLEILCGIGSKIGQPRRIYREQRRRRRKEKKKREKKKTPMPKPQPAIKLVLAVTIIYMAVIRERIWGFKCPSCTPWRYDFTKFSFASPLSRRVYELQFSYSFGHSTCLLPVMLMSTIKPVFTYCRPILYHIFSSHYIQRIYHTKSTRRQANEYRTSECGSRQLGGQWFIL